MSMKPRHASALALLGWYLMAPPVSTDGGKVFVDSRASVRKWTRIERIFGSSADCDKARIKFEKNAQNREYSNLEGAARMDANIDDQTIAEFKAARLMKCVPTDDPHLKGIYVPVRPAWSGPVPAN
jgi:hypothetical protein